MILPSDSYFDLDIHLAKDVIKMWFRYHNSKRMKYVRIM
jgi:hypothetical protein